MKQAKLYGFNDEVKAVFCCAECSQVLPREIENTVSCSADIYQLMRALDYDKDKQEKFVVFSVNTRNDIIDRREVAVGGVNTVHVHPSEVIRPAVLHGCPSILVAHNHPSGDSTPSSEDRMLTTRISEACSLMGIRMLDHVVVAQGNYYSFADSGAL